MKTTRITTILFITYAICGCYGDNREDAALCDYPTGDVVTEQLGRIYEWRDISSDRLFYYIGNPDTLLANGGFVPCRNLPAEFATGRQIGALVTYSGIVKLGRSSEEPQFFGIELTSIKKVR
jgi:hypothetical protein